MYINAKNDLMKKNIFQARYKPLLTAVLCLGVWNLWYMLVLSMGKHVVVPTARGNFFRKREQKTALHTCSIGETTVVVIPKSSLLFLIIGAQKSGTSSLFRYLLNHPNAVPPANWKRKKSTETHFFDHNVPPKSSTLFASDEEYFCYVRRYYLREYFEYNMLFHDATKGDGALFSFEKLLAT